MRFDTHVAPLGLEGWSYYACYTHIAPLGLWVGQDARPTDVVRFDTHCAPLERGNWTIIFYRHIARLERKAE